MDRRNFLFFLSAGLLGQSLFGTESARQLLRYRFKKGEELRWNVLHMLKMKTIIGGKEENVETRSTSVKIWKTIEADAGGSATFEYRVEDIDMHQSQTGRNDAVYNSRRDKTIPPMFINLEGKIGIPLAHIKIDPLGKTEKKPLREYAGSMAENRIVIPLPNEAVDAGSSWTVPLPIELPQQNRTVKKIKAQQKFTLERILSGLANIKFETQILTASLTPNEESQILEHFAEGVMKLDLDAGHFVRQEATVNKLVVGVRGNSDSINYLSRTTECCCGRNGCEICKAISSGA
jgi:hypothetical protein